MTLRRCFPLVALALSVTSIAAAQPDANQANQAEAAAPRPSTQGLAVVGTAGAREDAFTLARAVYASGLRPRGLDELRARVLAGDPAPPSATKELTDLAELRAGVNGDDAASRQLLATIGRQLGVQGLLVVTVKHTTAPAPADADAGVGVEGAGAEAPAQLHEVSARLFVTETGELDAARYEPDKAGWRGTVTSLTSRFPPPARASQLPVIPPAKLTPAKDDKPFYKSPWLWGAVGAAALVGGFFFFLSQDSGDDPIHLQMHVPR